MAETRQKLPPANVIIRPGPTEGGVPVRAGDDARPAERNRMSTRATRSLLLTCTAIVVLSTLSVAAQDASTDGTALETIVLKGKRLKNGDIANTPLATETTEEEIEKKQVQSIEDLGRSLEPGVNFSRGTTNSLNIRGLEGSRVATLIDGVPLTYLQDTARSTAGGAESFDFFALTSVDVVRGADSSGIGDGGLGGALLLRTLEPEDLIGEGRSWGGKVGTGYDTMDESWYGGAAVAKRVENTSVLLLGSYKKGHERDNKGHVGGYGPTRTKANPADYDQYNLLFKLRQDTGLGHVFGLTAERFRFDKDTDLRRDQTPRGNYRPGDHSNGQLNERDRVSLDYFYEAEGDGLIDAAEAKLYWQKQLRQDSQDSIRWTSVPGTYKRWNDIEESGVGFNGFFDSGFQTGGVGHVLTFGTDLFISQAEQYSSGVDSCPAAPPYTGVFGACGNLHTNQADMPDVDSRRASFFVKDRMSFGDSGFSLTPALRYDWFDHDPKETPAYLNNAMRPTTPPGSSGDAWSPKLLAEYELSDNFTLFGQWAMGFRSPTASELYMTFGAPGTYLRTGNPDLEPETSNGFDIGARFGDDDFGGSLTFFHTRYKNFIENRDLTAAEQIARGIDPSAGYSFVQTPVNVARAEIYGIELAAHKRFDNGFNMRAGLAYARGTNLETDKLLASVPPLKAIVGLGYETEAWGVDLLWTGVEGVDDQSAASFKAPGYGIFDLTGWWEPEQVKGLRIQAGVFNVFDATYYDALNTKDYTTITAANKEFYSEPGRTFRISLTQRF